jgi:hypothetical protein
MNAITACVPTNRDRFTYDHITVEPVTPTIGAEISGVDLREPITPEIAADIQKALHDWRVVFFRDQDISNDQLKAFGRAFGPLTPAHPIAEGLEDHPEIWERTVDEYRTRRERNTRCRPAASRRATTRAGISTSPSSPTPIAIRSCTASRSRLMAATRSSPI